MPRCGCRTSTGILPALSDDAFQAESALIDQATLPDAIDLKGARPKADSSLLAPALDVLPLPLATIGGSRQLGSS